jgi:DNA-binding XRE family transcriptional regulator
MARPDYFRVANQTPGNTRDARVAHCFKELRYDRGWALERSANAAGVSRQSINSIECDRYVPSLSLVLTFAQGVRLLYRSDSHE